MKKYKLILSIDDQPIDAVYTGSLEEVDNYIFNNNINNATDLFKYINSDGKYDDRLGTYKFEIFSLEKPIKVIDLMYVNDIKKMNDKYKSFGILESDIFIKFVDDLDFNEHFMKKFVIPCTKQSDNYINGKKIINENRIHAYQLINMQNQYRDLLNVECFHDSDIRKKIEFENEKLSNKILYENIFRKFCHGIMAVKNNKTQKWKSKYDEKREFFTFFNFFDQKKPINTINIGIQNEDNSSKKFN